LSNIKTIEEQVEQIKLLNNQENIETKLDELINLLNNSNIDSQKVLSFRAKINKAFDAKIDAAGSIKAFQKVAENDSLSRLDMLNNFSTLLNEHQLDSELSKNYIKRNWLKTIVVSLIGIVLIILGFGMIIMPAPPNFEMFTIFYFTKDDGVTIMDVISLLIILCGVYIIIKTISQKQAE